MKFYLMNGRDALTKICFLMKKIKPEALLLPVFYD